MTYEPVDVQVLDSVTKQPLVGVVVKVLSLDGKLVFNTLVTNTSGIASALLPAPAIYQVRCYQFSTTFSKPLLIDVQPAPVVNQFQMFGRAFIYPEAVDQRLCMASGFFRTPSGAPARHVDLQFIATFDPVLLDGSPVLTERVTVHTDKDGYVEVSLIRFGIYEVAVQGMEDMYRKVYVPDASRVNIGDLILPVVTGVTFAEGTGPFTMNIGQQLVLTPTVLTSDFRVLPDIASDLLWSLSNQSVSAFQVTPTSILLKGLVSGSVDLLASRRPNTPIRIPNTPVTGVPVMVIVP